jgi:protein-L-isoaspartate(D-aspartate) O-methyltransferase
MADEALAAELKARGISNKRVLEAIAKLRRADFVPDDVKDESTGDYPLPIGFGQTISQPYVVAFMSEALKLTGDERVLEIGTGSGYQAAILAGLCAEVYTIEIVPDLAERSREALTGYANVHVRQGDGSLGWPEAAPFDRIVLTAAPRGIPSVLLKQLRSGGALIGPVGPEHGVQELVEICEGVTRRLLAVRFVPMTGASGPARRAS